MLKIKLTLEEASDSSTTIVALNGFLNGVYMVKRQHRMKYSKIMSDLINLTSEVYSQLNAGEYAPLDGDDEYLFTISDSVLTSEAEWLVGMICEVDATISAWADVGYNVPESFHEVLLTLRFAIKEGEGHE